MLTTFETKYVAIAASASLSDAVSTESRSLVGVIMPAAWTAADLTFKAGGWPPSAAAFADVYGVNGEVTYPADASQFVAIDPIDFLGCPQVQLRSGTSGTPVNQSAARTIGLVFRTVA